MMKMNGRILRALVCALAVGGNGVGVLGQERWKTPATPAGELNVTYRAMIEELQGDAFQQQEGGVVVGAPGEYSFTFVSSEMAFDSKVIKGAPFSADAVTESVQVLGDGNRITRSTTSKLYRDSEGRTRREQTLNGIGAWTTTEDAPQMFFINDPVAGTNYILNSNTHTGQKATQYTFVRTAEGVASNDKVNGEKKVSTYSYRTESSSPSIKAGMLNGKAIKKVQPVYPAVARAAGAQGSVSVEVTVDEQGNVASARAISGHQLLQPAAVEAARQWTFSPTLLKGEPVKVAGTITFEFALSGREGEATQVTVATPTREGVLVPPAEEAMMRARVAGSAKGPAYPTVQESLGKQSIEGVEAEGKRTTVTIPAGAIGNERAIQIVQESWYSSELQTVVMTKHSDPRFGETSYRLTNISRAEPDHSLFEVPAGYKISDGLPQKEQMWVLERKLQSEQQQKKQP